MLTCAGTPQHVLDEQTQPGFLQRSNSTSSSSSSSTNTSRSTSISTVSGSAGGNSGTRRRVKRKLRSKLGRRRSIKTEEEVIQEEEALSTEGPAPLASEKQTAVDEKAPESNAVTDGLRNPAANAVMNMTTATAPTATTNNNKRPFMGQRGLSVRPPPVFRNGTTFPQQAQQPRQPILQGQMRRYNSAPNMAAQNNMFAAPSRGGTGLSDLARPVSLAPAAENIEEAELGMWAAIILLLGSTALVAVCAEFMVSSIEHLVDNSPLSEAFIGLIILPIVGNAAEHVTAVIVASKNKLDLALGVALGSSIQIALLITPITIIIGWGLDANMGLYFTLFETVSLFVAVFVVCFLCLDGRSNWLEGTLLCAAYIIIAVGSFFFPDSEAQNTSTTPGSG